MAKFSATPLFIFNYNMYGVCSTTKPNLFEQVAEYFCYRLCLDNLYGTFFCSMLQPARLVEGGDEDLVEAKFFGLGNSLLYLAYRTYLSAQTYLTCKCYSSRYIDIKVR